MNFQHLFSFESQKIMAIINTTPDSFYHHSRSNDNRMLLSKVETALSEGADWIDIGGVSTRPGAKFVDVHEERKRVIPAIQSIKKAFPDTIISIDTFRHEIAREAVEFGASIINDVSFASDQLLLEYCAENLIPYVLMHMRGTPNNMMQNTEYQNVALEVYTELYNKLKLLREIGLTRVIVDPGFGFSKTLDQNYALLREFEFFKQLHAPLLVGVSRKSMIYNLLNTDSEHALNGTSVLHAHALNKGANILRVHDVKEAVEVRVIHEQLNQK